ncbi:LHFPL tetraspan subfamily member 7 protein-like [Tubulanus polymorphus]|uniref:LHFPL tetraspan subfamily member 7 protein-like n=1 Tax=Tubulanus polymorphus TaxID=672921 RepID=UPI003DA23BD5
MASPIGILWSLLSTMVAGTCSFSFMQPYWFINPDTLHGLGVYSYCAKEARYKHSEQFCIIYGGHFDFSHFPSSAWQAACVLYGGGCNLLCICALLALITLCVPKPIDKKIAVWTGYIQTLAVMIMVAGLVIYPLGLDSRFVQRHCPQATLYSAGKCHIGWGYMLAIMGTALSIFCPFLSHYTDMRVHDRMDRFQQQTMQRPSYRYV